MHRHELTDEEWERIRPLLPKQPGPRSKLGERRFISAVYWVARTGVPWRDLPKRYGNWKTVYNRFSRWADRGVWEQLFREVQVGPEPEASILDGSNVRAHQDAAGGKGGSNKMLWDALVEVFRRSCTLSSTRLGGRRRSR